MMPLFSLARRVTKNISLSGPCHAGPLRHIPSSLSRPSEENFLFFLQLKKDEGGGYPPVHPAPSCFPRKKDGGKVKIRFFFLKETSFVGLLSVVVVVGRSCSISLPPFVVPSLNFNQKRSILGSEREEEKRENGAFFRCCTIFYFRLYNRAGEKKL